MPNSSTQWVVVDNTDPSITYNPPELWTPQTVNISQPTDFLVPPLYGTYQQCQSNNANFSFTFTGVDIIASFSSAETTAIHLCTLDGQPMTIKVVLSILQCLTNASVSHGSHTFMVILSNQLEEDNSLPLLFDYIIYDPSDDNVVMTNVDVQHGITDPSIKIVGSVLESPGDSLDFMFIGIYSSFLNNSYSPAPASYSIDENPPVNFTINVFATNLALVIGPVIVLQTPRYSLGQHHFHLDYWGDAKTNNSVPLFLDFIIAQNLTTPHVLLDSFPPMSSPSPSTTKTLSIVANSSTVSTFSESAAATVSIVPSARHGPIIGGATAGATILVLIILTFLIYRRRRLQVSTLLGGTDNSNDITAVVEPFQQQHSSASGSRKNRGNERYNDSGVDITRPEDPDVEPNLFIEPFYHWRTHFRSFRKHRILRRRSDPEHVPIDTRNIEPRPTQITRERPLRYRVHEDSGEQITQPDEGSIIFDLPPTYTTIGFTAPPVQPTNDQDQPLEPRRREDEARREENTRGDPRSDTVTTGPPDKEEPLEVTTNEGGTDEDVGADMCKGDV